MEILHMDNLFDDPAASPAQDDRCARQDFLWLLAREIMTKAWGLPPQVQVDQVTSATPQYCGGVKDEMLKLEYYYCVCQTDKITSVATSYDALKPDFMQLCW